MKMPVRAVALLASGFLMGNLLVPASAQQNVATDNQVAVRSDGAVYLIANGMRRWVATVVISDEELNNIPEGDPIYGGLAFGGSSSSNSSSSSNNNNKKDDKKDPTPTPEKSKDSSKDKDKDKEKDSEENSDDLDIEFEDISTVKQGEDFTITVKTKKNVSCELKITYPDKSKETFDDEDSGSKGRCKWDVSLDDDVKTGTATAKVTVRDGGKKNDSEQDFTIKKG
ncbi:MAG: hypothetical protein U0821_09640 [Chloroflexota bacterium]